MDFITLSQLNLQVRQELKSSFHSPCWMLAETSDVRINNRHCYLEFIEKDPRNGQLQAKARGTIWAGVFDLLKPCFEQETGQSFISGLKVLVNVQVEFHPLYGYSLNVLDIDPAYTLGDMQARRREILSRLESEGVLTLNKELELPLLPQRIAVVSSPTAAGYGDFLNHLETNRYRFIFYPVIFQATMQGDQTEPSVVAALEKIYRNREKFDAVVIIRGGGATSDLNSFDSYLLAAACAQFPLPVITGIGHERDDTVLDMVAFHRAKTPTAAADYLIERCRLFAESLMQNSSRITGGASSLLKSAHMNLKRAESTLPIRAANFIEVRKGRLEFLWTQIQSALVHTLSESNSRLQEKEAFLKLSSPEYILAKGYSITRKRGKAVKDFTELSPGDELETVLHKGIVKSSVKGSSSGS